MPKQKDDVTAVSVGYRKMEKDWKIVVDLAAGTRRMRQRGAHYLPKEPLEKQKDYNIRRDRSFLYNMFKAAVRSIVSQSFAKRAKTLNEDKLPERLASIPGNVDGAGTDLNTFASMFYESIVGLGHGFIFVDYTDVKSVVGDREVSKLDEQEIGARAIFKIIRACDMLDWRHEVVNGVKRLSWVKFREVRVERVGEWDSQEVEYIHVWDAAGTFQIWKNNKEPDTNPPITGEYFGTRPFDQNRGEWTLATEGNHSFNGLPIVEVYTNKTNDMMSEPPLIELAWTNLEHYQSASDQRNILRFARLAQKVITGSQGKDLDKDNLKASVHNVMVLKGKDAKAYYLEHSGKGIEAGAQELTTIEERARSQGARPSQERTINSTATGAMIDLMSVTSDAQAWVMELAIGLRQAFDIAGKWTGDEIPDEFQIELNSEFAQKVNPESYKYVESIAGRGRIRHVTELAEAVRYGVLSDQIDPETEAAAAQSETPFEPDDEPDDVPGDDDPDDDPPSGED